jgi:AcrR family transcriptional regulator
MTPRHKETEKKQVMSATRQRLVEAAIQEFARYGYDNANINRISTVAGFAKGTIYNYFPSKRALMLALIEETAKLHLDFITTQVLQEESAGRRMERFFEAGFEFVATYLTQGRVMINSLYGPDPEFKQVMYQAYLPMFELVGRDIIGLGISQGIFRPVNPTATAGLLMNIYLGIASQANEEGRTWQSADQVADFALNGLRKQAG